MSTDDLFQWNPDPVAECDRCHRRTWTLELVDTEDRMTQPDGNPCGGRFVDIRT